MITNVPYLARGKQGEILRNFCENNYKAAKNELSTVFLERCLEFCSDEGNISLVIPQNWMFLTSYKQLRKKLLSGSRWNLIVRLGFDDFDIMDWWAFNTSLISITRCEEWDTPLFTQKRESHRMCGVDVSSPRTVAEKAIQLITAEIRSLEQVKQLKNQDSQVTLEEWGEHELL